ncbi:MAG: hypothetical protein ACI9WC_003691 [Arenicella sp.]|jgi:hypothetical protein
MVIRAIQNGPLIYKGRIPLATSAKVNQTGLAAKWSSPGAQSHSLSSNGYDRRTIDLNSSERTNWV